MKPKSVTILSVSLLFLAVALFISDRRSINRLERQMFIQSAKADFLMQPGNKDASIDSTHINNDTLSFFRKDSLIGKSVITTE